MCIRDRGALGAVMALYAREKNGIGQVVNTNLLNAGCLLLAGDFARYENKVPRRLSDKHQNGLSDFHRLYQTLDGYIYVSAERSDLAESFTGLLGLQNSFNKRKEKEHTELGNQIQDVIKLKESAYWVELMGLRNIPCSISIENYELSFFQDEQAFQNNMISKSVLDDGREYAFSHNLIQFPELPIPVIKPTPMLGEHSIEILREFGIEESLIDSMIETGSLITS